MYKVLLFFLMITITPHTLIASQAKPHIKTEITVRQAIEEAALLLSGEALKSATKKINEQSVGGLNIEKNK